MTLRSLLWALLWLAPRFLSAQTLPNPILFCTQVPNPNGFGSSMETFGNHQASMSAGGGRQQTATTSTVQVTVLQPSDAVNVIECDPAWSGP